MDDGSRGVQVTVCFVCRCGTVYSAAQEHLANKQSGVFNCEYCGWPVHEWSGFYSYSGWKRFMDRFRRPGRRR